MQLLRFVFILTYFLSQNWKPLCVDQFHTGLVSNMKHQSPWSFVSTWLLTNINLYREDQEQREKLRIVFQSSSFYCQRLLESLQPIRDVRWEKGSRCLNWLSVGLICRLSLVQLRLLVVASYTQTMWGNGMMQTPVMSQSWGQIIYFTSLLYPPGSNYQPYCLC